MTDNEIIKALECCSKDDGRGCPEDCPCYERDCAKDLYFIEKQAVDLINRQKAEIKSLINGQETLQKHIAEQKSEIERLNKTVVDLNANLSEAINCFTRMESLYKIKCKELDVAKANAIKEFAEKVCAGRASNDPVVIAVNVELGMSEKERR